MAIALNLDRSSELRDTLDHVSHQLVRIQVEGADGYIVMPHLYPGGAPVIVHVRRDDDEYLVTDQGRAYSEADIMGATSLFGRIARQVASAAGVEFDGHMMFAARVPKDWLANAIIFVAAASKNAVELALEKLTVGVEETLRERLKIAVNGAFRNKASFDVTVPGHSSKPRNFAAMVRSNDRTTLFDIVMPSPVSVSFAIVKFQDVALAEGAPSRVALFGGKVDAGDQTLLSRWATVAPFNDNGDFLQLAV